MRRISRKTDRLPQQSHPYSQRRTASSAACGRGSGCRWTTFPYLTLGARVHPPKSMAFGIIPDR
jgi:hypothetical protein